MAKKFLLVLVVAGAVGAANAYAVGLGGFLQMYSPVGEPRFGGVIISPTQKLHIAIQLPLTGIGIGGACDFMILSKPVLELSKGGSLNFNWGVGGSFIAMFGDATAIGARARMPVGLSWKYQKFDVFIQTVPSVVFEFGDKTNVGPGVIPIELGIRYWFK